MRPSDPEILRELLRASTMWSGTVSPADTAPEIARRLGTGRSTVWARIRRWQRTGFLRRVVVAPNPSLFGYLLGAGRLSMEGSPHLEKLLAGLENHNGVVGSVDCAGGQIQVNVVAPDIEGFHRWTRFFSSLPGVSRAYGFEPYQIPDSNVELSDLDWRLLEHLLNEPDSGLAGASRALHLSPRSAARRHQRLFDGHAMWYVPELELTRQSGVTYALFNIWPGATTQPGELVSTVQDLVPTYVELSDESRFSVDPQFPMRVVYMLAAFGSAAEAEATSRAIHRLEGVEKVELLFPVSYRWYTHWFLEQMASRTRRDLSRSLRRGPGDRTSSAPRQNVRNAPVMNRRS